MKAKTQNGLNPIQLHLLQMFNRNLSKKEMDEIKDILVDFFDKKAQHEMDKIWKKKKLNQKKIDEMGNTHTRKKSK